MGVFLACMFDTYKEQKRASDALRLKFQTAVSCHTVLRIKSGSLGRESSVPNH